MKNSVFFWGVGGILLLLGCAVYRLAHTASQAFNYELSWWHWLLLLANLLIMIYYEGYKGFHLAFSPRVAARANYLVLHGRLRDRLLAPVFCMAYYAATRRRMVATWILTISIIILIMIFHQLPQPIRGILDLGVVAGLSLGMISTLIHAVDALTNRNFNRDPEVK